MLRDEESLINEIPAEMRLHIFSFVASRTVPKLSQVCKLWNNEAIAWELLGFKSKKEAKTYLKSVKIASDYNTALDNRSDTISYIIVSEASPMRERIFKIGLAKENRTKGMRQAQVNDHTIYISLGTFGLVQEIKEYENPEADFIFLIPLDKRAQLNKYLEQLANIQVPHLAFFIVDEAITKELAPLPKNTILLSKSDDLESFHAKIENKILDLSHPEQQKQQITPFINI